jgi:PAS domain S-box-containing protein
MTSIPTGTTNGGGIDREYRQQLRKILSGDENSSRRIQQILQLGADWFNVDLGLLVEMDQSGETYTIDEVSTSHPDITRGLTGDLLSTYCRMVVVEEEPLALENAPEQGWLDEPAYQNSLLATYIGTEVLTDQDVYGTVCFVDLEPRHAPFDDEDRTFLELIANVVGRVVERRTRSEADTRDTPQDLSVVERRYRTALKHSPVLFAKVDRDLRYEWIYNPHPDFDPEASVGKRDDELDSGPGIDQLMDLKRRTLERGEQFREEITFERTDGLNVYDITATPLREGSGDEVTGLVTASLNITEQKETERKYRESEARYRALAENFPNGAVGVYDRDLRYSLVEGTLVGDVLPETDAFTGTRMRDLFPEETVADIEPLFRAAVEEGVTDSVETEFEGRDWKVWATPLRDSEGTIYAGLSLAQDITDRKEREAALRRQRNLLEQTQRLAGGWEVDLKSGTVSWSEEVYRVHDLPPSTEIELEDTFAFYPPEAREQLRAAFERCTEEGEPYDLEVPLVSADDNQRWVRTVGAPAETEDGEVVRVAGAFQDITDRKETEKELREREAWVRGLTNSVPGVVFQAYARPGRKYGFYHVSEHAEDLLGISRDPTDFFERCLSRVPDSEQERLMKVIDEAVEAEERLEFEAPFVTPSGEKIWLLGTAMPEPREDETVYNGVILDITQRKRTENALQEQEARLRGLANSIPGVVYQFVAEDEGSSYYRFVSEHTEEVLGISSAPDGFHERFLDRVPASHRAETREATTRAIREETPLRIEIPFDRPDGERIWLLCTSTPARQGEHLVFDGVMLDITDRKEIEHALREQETRLRGLANSIPGVVFQFYVRPDGTYGNHFVSEHAETVLGISSTPDTFYERAVEHIPPAHRDRFRRSIEEAVEHEEPWQVEVPFDRPDGTRIWLLGTSTPERREDELVYNGVLLNITEQKRAEQRLREERDRFATLFHNLPTPVVHGEPDEEGRLRARSVNAAFESVFGVTEEEVRDEDIQALIVPPGEQDSADSIRRRLLAGESVDREVRRTTSTGLRDFRVQVALRDGESGPREGYGIYTDITERKRRERTLQERQEKVEALYKATNRLLRADNEEDIAASIIDLVNEVFGYLVGVRLAKDEALVPVQLSPEISEHTPPRPTFDIDGEGIVARAFRDQDTIAYDDLRTADDPFDYGEVRATVIIPIGKHGTISVGTLEVGAIDDFDRRLIEVLATYASTSLDRLDREEALIAAKEEAEEAARLKSSMMANMSHEIRTPLTSIIGFAEILTEHLDGELGTFAQKAHRSSNRLMRTLESVLELSRLEAGTFDLPLEPVQLTEVVESTVDRFRPEARQQGLSLHTQLPDQSLTVRLSEEAVRRILENLLENAIKFTSEGGTITVRLQVEATESLLEVEDSGVGISEDALPDIFKAFKQESEGLDREYEGSGLGLSIVQELTEALDGTLDVETEKGEGSRFIVQFPCNKNEESGPED